MNIFLSWSGSRSKIIAEALREWLPLVIDYVEPYMSDMDIEAGERWSQSVSKGLAAANFGVVCLTPENVNKPWILFEAGAMAKSFDKSRVVPLLFDMKLGDLEEPLSMFQAKKLDRQGVLDTLNSIQHHSDGSDIDAKITRRFEGLWDDFEKAIKEVPPAEVVEEAEGSRSSDEILEDLVETIRSVDARTLRLLQKANAAAAPAEAFANTQRPKNAEPGLDTDLLVLKYRELVRDSVKYYKIDEGLHAFIESVTEEPWEGSDNDSWTREYAKRIISAHDRGKESIGFDTVSRTLDLLNDIRKACNLSIIVIVGDG